MGEQGKKGTETAALAVERFTGRVMPLGEITYKKMFGGFGVFESGTMFALVTSEGGVYLKEVDANRTRLEQAGAKKHGRMPYYQIPEAIMEDDHRLFEWVREAITGSKSAKK